MFAPHQIKSLRPLNDNVLVLDMPFVERNVGGIVLLSDNGTGSGIRPRWAQVYAVGPTQQDVKVGQWICVSHGRWTRGVVINDGVVKTIRKVDIKDILMVSDEEVNDETMSTAVNAYRST